MGSFLVGGTSGTVALTAFAACLASCAPAVESTRLEDGARRVVPVPICLKPLPRHGGSGVVSALTPDDYWSMILPSYDPSGPTVDPSSSDCAGRPLLTSPELAQAEGTRTGQIRAAPDDIVVGSGPDGFKVVWLRTHRFSNGTAGGPLALVRAKPAYAEVYAVGLYKGTLAGSRFGFERLGPDILVTAVDEGCTGVKSGQSCETSLVLMLSRAGELKPSARVSLDRVQYGQASGIPGTVQYRLTATPVYQDKGVRIVEQIVVRDAGQNELRKSDLERVFALKGDTLTPSGPSLWSQVVGGDEAPAPRAQPAPSNSSTIVTLPSAIPSSHPSQSTHGGSHAPPPPPPPPPGMEQPSAPMQPPSRPSAPVQTSRPAPPPPPPPPPPPMQVPRGVPSQPAAPSAPFIRQGI
jgi:hypothetical protein